MQEVYWPVTLFTLLANQEINCVLVNKFCFLWPCQCYKRDLSQSSTLSKICLQSWLPHVLSDMNHLHYNVPFCLKSFKSLCPNNMLFQSMKHIVSPIFRVSEFHIMFPPQAPKNRKDFQKGKMCQIHFQSFHFKSISEPKSDRWSIVFYRFFRH